MQFLPVPQEVCVGDGSSVQVTAKLRAAVAKALETRESAAPVRLKIEPAEIEDLPGLPPTCVEQAYVLDATAKTITITAGGAAGLLYGLQTLVQLVDQTQDGTSLPAVSIVDYPALQWRGLQYDLARRMVYRHEHMKDVIRHMAALKLNMLHLYLEGRFAFPSHPELHQPGWMTPAEARDLCAFAKAHHVVLVPEVNCLGHMEQILHVDPNKHLREDPADSYMICPSNPQSLPFVLALVDDLVDAFDTPYIHIGMDEVPKLGFCSACRARLQKYGHPGKILAEHINAIAAHLRQRGRRSLMWGDMLLDSMQFPGAHAANGGVTGWGSLNYTAKALEWLDRDVVICDWQYAHFSPDEMDYLRALGFDLMPAIDSDERGCPWGPARGIDFHIRNFFDAAKESGAIGAFTTTWSLHMGEVFNNRWLDFAKSAETMWSRHGYEPEEFGRRFCSLFFGLDEALIPYLDKGIKIDVLPNSMRLVPHLLKLDQPWRIFGPPQWGTDPIKPLGSPAQLIAAKEQYLVQWRKTVKCASRRAHLLDAMDVPLRVDILAMRMFHLRASIAGIYSHAEKHAGEPLVHAWCRDALLTGIDGLMRDAECLRRRFACLYETFGNDGEDVVKSERFLVVLQGMREKLATAEKLPPKADWCPAELA